VETIKTAVVVVLLLAVMYGVYVVLNKPELEPPPEVALQQESVESLEVDTGIPDTFGPLQTPGTDNTGMPVPPAMEIAGEPGAVPAEVPAEPVAGPADFADIEPATSPGPGGLSPPPDPAVMAESVPATEPQDVSAGDEGAAAQSVPDPPSAVDDVASSVTSDEPVQEQQTSVYENPPKLAAQSEDSAYQSVRAFDSAWSSATSQLEKGQFSEALLTLSLFYDDPTLSGEERQRLIDLLDPLAGKVIYSSESYLEAPYEIKSDETLYDIAERFQIPVTLLQNINSISNPDAVWPGTTIKVLRGPFRAVVDTGASKLVLYLGKYYAGQFSISTGNDPAPQPAEYEVLAKQPGHDYAGADGRVISARSADNPYGQWWIDLGQGASIHGASEAITPDGGTGCISLDSADAADVYGILSVRSKVLIR
jgi:LysM repeat protein